MSMKHTFENNVELPPILLPPSFMALLDPPEFKVRVLRGAYKRGVYKVVDVYPATTGAACRFLIELGEDEGDIVPATYCVVLGADDPEPLHIIKPKKRKYRDGVDEDEYVA
jgi:hypothetical protein